MTGRDFTATCLLIFSASGALAQERGLDAAPVRLNGEMALLDVLASLEKQTGNVVVDRRGTKNNPRLTLKSTTFWSILDEIGKSHGIGHSPYQADEIIALTDSPYRPARISSHGPFRTSFKGVTAILDEETQSRTCQIALELAWEPRLRPLFLNVQEGAMTFGAQVEKLTPESLRGLTGSGATELLLRFPAPPRSVQSINSLKGSVRLITAPDHVTFTFSKLENRTAVPRDVEPQKGMTARLMTTSQSNSLWSFNLKVEYPPGAIPAMESHQQTGIWENNRYWLSWIEPSSKEPRRLEPRNLSYASANNPAIMNVALIFRANETTALPPKGAAVTLHVRVPTRVATVTVPFEFRDLPLP